MQTTQLHAQTVQSSSTLEISHHPAYHRPIQCTTPILTGRAQIQEQQLTLNNASTPTSTLLTGRHQSPAHQATEASQPIIDPRLPAPKPTDWIGALYDCYTIQRQLHTLGKPIAQGDNPPEKNTAQEQQWKEPPSSRAFQETLNL